MLTNKQLINRLQNSNNKCPICMKYVEAKDIYDLNVIFCETKKKQNMFAHKNCMRYKKKGGKK